MLSLGAIAGSGSRYYLGRDKESARYYPLGEATSFWGGKARNALGLDAGPVKAEDFDRLLEGRVSKTQRIGNPSKEDVWNHDAGRDLTFSDPKSVSILMQTSHRARILDLRKKAVETAMTFVEDRLIKARIKGENVGGQKAIWAAMHEETSRANDPQGHFHVVLFNIVQDKLGRFRAMDNQALYDNQILLGQIYRSELAMGLKEMGYSLERVGQNGQWEIKEVPETIRQSFSERRQAILEAIDPKNDTARSRELICLKTRPKKTDLHLEDLRKTWDAKLETHGLTFEDLALARKAHKTKAPWTIAERVKTTLNIVAETQSEVERFDLFKEVMSQSWGHFTLGMIEGEIEHQVELGYIQQSKCGHFYARSVDLRRKQYVTDELQKGHLKSKPLLSKRVLENVFENSHLKSDQKEAARLLALSPSRYVKIQGHAGVGKTTALRTVLPPIKQCGYKLIGLSTTGASTQELAETGVFHEVMSLQKFLLVPRGNSKTVLVVDESSQIGRDQMLSLLKFTNQKRFARVVFQGDGKQMSGVQAGHPFKDMEADGVRSVIMDQIIRQSSTRHREGLIAMTEEKLEEAFSSLRPEIHEIEKDQLNHYAVETWLKNKDERTPVIIQTNKQKTEINQLIKSTLNAGKDTPQLTLKTWQPVHKTQEEKRFLSAYENASHIRFNRDYKRLGLKRGDIFKIENQEERSAALILSKDGRQKLFKPAKFKMGKGAIELYKQEERSFGEGDRIKFTRGGHKQPVFNNDIGKVISISEESLTIALDRGKELTLSMKDKAIRHVDHAWANTAHAFQGKTVDHAIVVMPSRRGPLTSLESLYTSTSRHRSTLTLITDNAQQLKRSIEYTLEKEKIKADIKWSKTVSEKNEIESITTKTLQNENSQRHRSQTLALKRNTDKIRIRDRNLDIEKENHISLKLQR